MNDIANIPSTLTMTSRAIAEVTGKEHRNVTRDIRNMLSELGIDALTIEHIYKDAQNRDQTEYVLDKELTITLTSGYSIVQRNAIIKRWIELEGQQKPMSMMEMVIASAQQHIENERRMASVETKTQEITERLDQIDTAVTDFTIKGWCTLTGAYPDLTSDKANAMGRQASNYCRKMGYPVGKVTDPLWGRINTYPKDVLDFLLG